jgi:SAM-dependent methyltransferase
MANAIVAKRKQTVSEQRFFIPPADRRPRGRARDAQRRDILQLMEDREVLFYNRLVQEHRGTSMQVGARSEASQTARFEVILDVLDSMLGEKLTGLSLLDFGCGKGDLAVYLERQGRLKTVRYIGLDAIKENIEDALGAMPSCDFRLGTWNGDQNILDEPVDLIVFSGTLATTSHDRRIGMYASLLGQARVGVVGNWVTYTPGVIYDGEGTIPMKHEDAFRVVDRAEFRVQVRADYLRHDFTIGAVRWSF